MLLTKFFKTLISGDFHQIQKWKVDHFLFWIFYTFFWVFVSGELTQLDTYKNAVIIVAFHAILSYFNAYILVPVFLQKKKYLSYLLALVLSISAICFPLALVFYGLNQGSVGVNDIWDVKFFLVNYVSATYTVAVTMIIRLYFQWHRREQQNRELEKINKETELKYLKSQINPHFLFNSLNSLYAKSLKKSDDTPDLILKLSDMLRYLLYETTDKKVPLQHELDYIKNYLELEKIRLTDKNSIFFEVIGSSEDIEIEPMLFIPFIENSFKHGISNFLGNGYIKCGVYIDENKILFLVENNYSDKKRNLFPETGGIGIVNVRKRLELLYPNEHELQINDSNGVFKVELKIMLN